MPFLNKKDVENIQNDLRETIIGKLLNGFNDRRGRPVIEVEAMNISTVEYDEENSDRCNVIITNVEAFSHVWVSIDNNGSKTNDNFRLRNSKPITFTFNDKLKKYLIQNEDEIIFFNTTPF